MRTAGVVVRALVLHCFTIGRWWAAAAEAHQFCSRAGASSTCAQPPTVDDIKVEAYLGKWYEIGSSASFKLLTESGLACDQALYRATPDGHLTLLNSGLHVISPLAVPSVGAINVAAQGVCAGARGVCSQLAALRQLSASSALTNSPLGIELATLADAAQLSLQKIADDVSFMQQLNGQISQADYSPSSSLQSTIAALKNYLNDASKEQTSVGQLVAKLNKISTQIWQMWLSSSNKQSQHALQNASLSLATIAVKLGASSTAAEVALKAVSGGAAALLKSAQPIANGRVSSVTGNITQPSASSAGKLQVRINGVNAPYWIIAVEKGASPAASYSAALVYSCSEVAGTAAKSLFVLSRQPQLDKATLTMLLAKAESYGIYNECDDPFLLTVQRGGDCGKPTSSV